MGTQFTTKQTGQPSLRCHLRQGLNEKRELALQTSEARMCQTRGTVSVSTLR